MNDNRSPDIRGNLPSASLSDASLESVTQLIERAQGGHEECWDRVYRLMYDELRQAARVQLRRRQTGGSATSLVNRAWLRLDPQRLSIADRGHLLALLARAMRYAVLDEIRDLKRLKRTAGQIEPSDIDPCAFTNNLPLEELLALDKALDILAEAKPRLAQLVEMRYYSGMTEAEIAQAMNISDRTVQRDWNRARAFLVSQLGGGSVCEDGPDMKV